MKFIDIKISNLGKLKIKVAQKLYDEANKYVCDIKFVYNNDEANVKSVISLMSLIANISSKNPTLRLVTNAWDDCDAASNAIVNILKTEGII